MYIKIQIIKTHFLKHHWSIHMRIYIFIKTLPKEYHNRVRTWYYLFQFLWTLCELVILINCYKTMLKNAVYQSSLYMHNMLWLMTGCEIGKYGKGCSNQCSGHCLDNLYCNPTTGHCDSGCAPGYIGPFCNKSMNTIFFN